MSWSDQFGRTEYSPKSLRVKLVGDRNRCFIDKPKLKVAEQLQAQLLLIT